VGFSISAYRFKENVSPEMVFDCPFTGGKFVGDEIFCDIVSRRGDTIYLDDYHQPYWYQRPSKERRYEIEKSIKEQIPTNAEHFIEFLEWLCEHPDIWIEGSH
jgi:hypothetical protein